MIAAACFAVSVTPMYQGNWNSVSVSVAMTNGICPAVRIDCEAATAELPPACRIATGLPEIACRRADCVRPTPLCVSTTSHLIGCPLTDEPAFLITCSVVWVKLVPKVPSGPVRSATIGIVYVLELLPALELPPLELPPAAAEPPLELPQPAAATATTTSAASPPPRRRLRQDNAISPTLLINGRNS